MNNIYSAEIIKSIDGKQEYAVDLVREQFLRSDKSLEELALQMNLPLAVIEHHAKAGVQSWYDLKTKYLSERMKYFLEVNIDNLMETHSVLEDGHFLTLLQMKSTQEFYKAYYVKHGHLFRVSEDGEISVDTFGAPIEMPLPNKPRHFMALEAYLKIKESTKQAMNQVYEDSKKEGAKNEVLDVTATGFFDEKTE